MTIHDTSAALSVTVNRTSPARVMQSNTDGVMFVQGEINSVFAASASMKAAGATIIYVATGTSGTGSGSVSVDYPANSTSGRLAIFAGAFKKNTDPWTNANFKRAGYGLAMLPYEWERPAGDRASFNNALGGDLGPTRVEHQIRELTATASGSETFTTAGTSGDTLNTAAAGVIHLFQKESAKEWIIKSYGQWGNSEDSVVGAATYYMDLLPTSQFKLSTQIIRGLAHNPGICTLAAGSSELWITVTGFEWRPLTYPFGADIIYRMRFGNGVFIAVGASGKIGRSVDNGKTWTVTQPLGSAFQWYGVRYYNNRWIACGAGGRLVTSDDDGQTWTQRTTGFANIIWDVAWGSGIFVDPDTPGNSRPAWNSGQGIWWFAGQSHSMFRSDDNGTTWTEGTYYTGSPPWSTLTSGSPTTVYYSDSRNYGGQFSVVGARLGDYFDYGYYQNATNWGFWRGDEGSWRSTYSGSSYGHLWYGSSFPFYAKFAYARDAVQPLNTDGIHASEYSVHHIASSYYNGIRIGQSETSPAPTSRPYQRVEYSVDYQQFGKPIYEDPEIVPGTGWHTYGNLQSQGYFYRDGGTYSRIKGTDTGDIWTTEFTGLGTDEGRYDEKWGLSGNNYKPDIRDGDLILVSISASHTSDVISNVNFSVHNPQNSTLVTSGLSFTPMVDLGTVTSTSGDKVVLWSGYCYAIGKMAPIFWENTSYGVTDSRRWQISDPKVRLNWDANSPVAARGAYSAVITVLRSKAMMTVDMEANASITTECEVRKTGIQPGAPGHMYTASMTVDAFVEPNSTPGYVTGVFFYDELSSSTISWPVNFAVPAKDLLVIMTVTDNLSATTPTISISDTKGNTWTQMGFKGQNASAAAGVVAAIHYSYITNPLTTSDTVTTTLSGAVVCRMAVYLEFTGIGSDGERSAAVTAGGSSATPTVTSGTVNTGDLVVAIAGVENAVAPTADSDTLNGAWNCSAQITGSGGNAAGHMARLMGYKIVTGAGAQTFNPATSPSTDWVEIIGVFANNPKKPTAAVLRPTASMAVTSTVNRTYITTGSASAVADMTAECTVDKDTSTVIRVEAIPSLTATAVLVPGSPASASAVASMTVTGYIPLPQNTTATLTTNASMAVDGAAGSSTWASLISVAQQTVTTGNVHHVTATCVATASMENVAPYSYSDNTIGWPDFDFNPTPWNWPEFDVEGWFSLGSMYGNTGRVGNVMEITNRHYWDALKATESWPSFPNGPKGFLNYDAGTTVGARAHAITPLGGDRFLVTWIQENWAPYHLVWEGADYMDRTMNIPTHLCAMVLDCSGGGDPVIRGSNRYDLPDGIKHWRNGTGQSARSMGDGRVACVWSGFTAGMPSEPDPDYGTHFGDVPLNIICVVTASNVPTFNWVKTYAAINSHEGWDNEVMINGNDVCVASFGYDSTVVHKFSGSGGALLGSSVSTAAISDNPLGIATCANEGSKGYIFGDNGFEMTKQAIDLNSLSWSAPQPLLYQDGAFNPRATLYRSKRGDDGYWYAQGTHSGTSMLSVYKLVIADGLQIVDIHMSDVAHEYPVTSSGPYMFGNAYMTNDWIETWNRIGTSDTVYTLYPKTGFCPGVVFPSVAGMAEGLATNDQYPVHTHGPQVVAYIPPIADSATPSRATSWVSAPVGASSNSWQHYWDEYDPQFGEIDIAETSTGYILVVMSCVDYMKDTAENGSYRIFTFLVDPMAEHPPLKLSQRDDGKMVGGDRIGYDAQNSGSIRAGRVAW